MNDILERLRFGLFRNVTSHKQKAYYEGAFVSRFNDIESYKLLVRNTKLAQVRTEKDITFSRSLTFGMEPRDFIRRLGKPKDQLRQTEPFNRQILYYKFMMGPHKAKCELHFYNNKLFLYCFSFPYLSEEDKKGIVRILCEKYTDGVVDMEKCKITDKHSNTIFINDIMYLTINYVAARSELFTQLNPANPAAELPVKKKKSLYESNLFRML